MTTVNHYFEPERMAKTYGNRPACCSKPASDHKPFADGTVTKIALTRAIRYYTFEDNQSHAAVMEKGTVVEARRELYESYVEVSPSRWGTNSLGQFAELERTVLDKVLCPNYIILVGRINTAIPVRWGKEVA